MRVEGGSKNTKNHLIIIIHGRSLREAQKSVPEITLKSYDFKATSEDIPSQNQDLYCIAKAFGVHRRQKRQHIFHLFVR